MASEPTARAPRRPPPTVATKLVVPRTPRYLIIRKRLLDTLDAGIQSAVVLISSPAGSGKTILASSWVQTRRPIETVCWLSLDADDNDASCLAADLLSSLRGAGAIARGSPLERLHPPRGARAEAFMATLINGLLQLRSPFVLVLDDVHELTSSQAVAMLDFLVRHLPEQCRLVLIGRSDPAIPIERLRVDGVLTELRAPDLAFDRGEARSLCHQLDAGLSDENVELLWKRTEGWAAALRLACLSLRGHPEPARFLSEFAGTERVLSDYLVSEVLANIPEEHRRFVLRTSLVDAVSPGLAGALTGSGDAASTLAELERSGAPLQKLGDEGDFYRYHTLFGELLRAHLHHSHRDELPLLHRRAAAWYARNGQIKHAIRHALSGESWEHAACLIEDNWLSLFLAGDSATFREPMAGLPPEVIEESPRLTAAYAGSRLEDGDLETVGAYLALARRASAKAPTDERLEQTLSAVALVHARMQSDLEQAELCSTRLLELAGDPIDKGWAALRSFALCNLGATALWSAGDGPRTAEASLREGLALAAEDPETSTVLDCLGHLAVHELLHDRIEQSERLAGEALTLAEAHGSDEDPASAGAHLAAGTLAYWRGELDLADGLASRAVATAQRCALPVRLAAALLLALVLAAAGPRSAQRAAIKMRAIRATASSSDGIPKFLLAMLADAEPRVALAAGEVEAARAMLEQPCTHSRGRTALAVRRAELELHAGAPERAAELLTGALAASEAPSLCRVTQVEGWLLAALAHDDLGERQSAQHELEQALALAEPDRLCGPFVLYGRLTRDPLRRAAEAGTEHPALLETLLAAVDDEHARQPTQTRGRLAEPLTEREMRILRYLPTMLSNAEIGAETFVSLNTVKTHLRSIYRKLGAGSRADAVERARALGLLPRGIKRPRVPYRT